MSDEPRVYGVVPVGYLTSLGDFVCMSVCHSYYTEARLAAGVEYKQLSMCTMCVRYCSAWPKPGEFKYLFRL